MYSIVCKFSGGAGENAHLLRGVELFVNKRAPTSSMSSTVYDAIAADCQGLEQKPLTRMALIKAGLVYKCAYALPAKKLIQDRECTAEKMIKRFKELVGTSENDNVQKFVDEADCRIVVQLMNKGNEVPELNCDFKTVHGLIHNMLTHVQELSDKQIDFQEFADKHEEQKKDKKEQQQPNAKLTMLLSMCILATVNICMQNSSNYFHQQDNSRFVLLQFV